MYPESGYKMMHAQSVCTRPFFGAGDEAIMNHNFCVYIICVYYVHLCWSLHANMNVAWNARDYWYCYLIGPYYILVMSRTRVYGCPQTFPFYVRRSGPPDYTSNEFLG